MEDHNGPCVDIIVAGALTKETTGAREMLCGQRRRRVQSRTIGADKGYRHRDFVEHLRARRGPARGTEQEPHDAGALL